MKQCTPTDQLCQFVACTNLQVIKTRSSDIRSKIDLARVLQTVQKVDSQLRELHLTEWTFTAQDMLEVTEMILKNNWFSRNLLTLRVNKETFQAFA